MICHIIINNFQRIGILVCKFISMIVASRKMNIERITVRCSISSMEKDAVCKESISIAAESMRRKRRK